MTSLAFELPAESHATAPPEKRGLARDEVRLLVARPEGVDHRVFRDLPGLLAPGDLVVVNTTATVPAAVDALRADGQPVALHLSGELADGTWIAEVRCADGGCRVRDARVGDQLRLPGGARATLVSAHPDDSMTAGSRLWRTSLTVATGVRAYLATHGRPIRYGYVPRNWPLAAYQTVFAHEPGSAEMASAGRPFTDRLVTDLITRGVAVAPITLHTGVSSLERGERPLPEPYEVPESTARLVNLTRANGGRVVAVGTTVTRALETMAAPDGTVQGGSGVTELVLGRERPARVVTALVTGWHEPQASHLLLLEAVAGRPLVEAAYAAAVTGGYLWHEFGDSALLLPDQPCTVGR